MSDDSQGPDYDVGYGRPPRHTRFKAGQSGNPKGRKKGARNLATDLADELAEKILIREGGRERSVSKQRAMLKALVSKALKGDTRAAGLLIALVAEQLAKTSPADAHEAPSASDMDIVEDFLRRHSSTSPGGPNNTKAASDTDDV